MVQNIDFVFTSFCNTLDTMLEIMNENLISEGLDPTGIVRIRFHRLHQEGSVLEYIERFHKLYLVVSNQNQGLPEVIFVECFIKGLNGECKSRVQNLCPKSLSTAYSLARVHEYYLDGLVEQFETPQKIMDGNSDVNSGEPTTCEEELVDSNLNKEPAKKLEIEEIAEHDQPILGSFVNNKPENTHNRIESSRFNFSSAAEVGSILLENHVGGLSIIVKRDVVDASSKLEVNFFSRESSCTSTKEVAQRNLLKELTADESVVAHDTLSLGTVIVRHCGCTTIVKVVGDVKREKMAGSVDDNEEIDLRTSSLNMENSFNVDAPICLAAKIIVFDPGGMHLEAATT